MRATTWAAVAVASILAIAIVVGSIIYVVNSPGIGMIATIVLGLGLLLLSVVVVGIVDATQAAAWREVAAERRKHWESLRAAGIESHRDEDLR